ncbi:MAG: isoprenyl transferase [Maricaulaceae bacterium]
MTSSAPPATAGASAPRHVAIIMDGNGRWAQARARPRAFGHHKGVETVRATVQDAADLGLKYLTLFGFSTENWRRPREEVEALFDLMRRYVRDDLDRLHSKGVRIRIIGDRVGLDDDVLSIIHRAESITQDNTNFHLTIAFNYGGQDEIVRAVARIADDLIRGVCDRADLSATLISDRLDTAGLPDPDLVIRTSGEQRLSNFLIWQAAYAEFVVLDVFWPDFSRAHLEGALEEFRRRERRYGAVGDASEL